MKKIIFTLFILSFFIFCKSQNISLKKTWISDNLKHYIIDDTNIYYISQNRHKIFYYALDNDTLTLIDYRNNDIKDDFKKMPYKIELLTKDSLILKPLSELSKERIFRQNNLLLRDSASIYNPNLKFEKLFFLTTGGCLGHCPNLKIEIDSNGKVFFLGKVYTGKYTGFYYGKLNNDDFERLLNILKHAWLEQYPNDIDIGLRSIDIPYSYFVFQFDGITRAGSSDELFHENIMYFLLECYERANLKKLNYKTFPFHNKKIKLGHYSSIKDYPDFKCTFINDSIVNIYSSSRFYSNKTGIAKYKIENGKIVFNFAIDDLYTIEDTLNNDNDSITLYFYVLDKNSNKPAPFAYVSATRNNIFVNSCETDLNGYAKIRVRKSKKYYDIHSQFLGYGKNGFTIKANCSKKIILKMEEEKKIFDFTIRKIENKRIVLRNRDNIDLVLEMEESN